MTIQTLAKDDGYQVLWFRHEKWVQNKYDFNGLWDVSVLVVLRFSKLNGQMNSKDLAMVGGFLFVFLLLLLTQSVWHLVLVSLQNKQKKKTADKKGRGP